MRLHERSFGGFRLSPKPPTCWDEGSSSRCSRRQREAQSCQPISPAVQQYSLTPTASRKSTKTIKSTRLTIRRRTRRIQSKKSPVEKGRFRLAESDCIRNGLMCVFMFFFVFHVCVLSVFYVCFYVCFSCVFYVCFHVCFSCVFYVCFYVNFFSGLFLQWLGVTRASDD